MKTIILKSSTVLLSEILWVNNEINPSVADIYGGVLMCRISSNLHPIPIFYPYLSALTFQIPFKNHSSSLSSLTFKNVLT
jgi:hypothetical protein